MHGKHVDESQLAMTKRLRHRADDFESKLAPQRDGGGVGADDEVVLHREIPGAFRLPQAVAAERKSERRRFLGIPWKAGSTMKEALAT